MCEFEMAFKKSFCWRSTLSNWLHNLIEAKPENGYGFYRPDLKMGVENDIFWFEIGSGFWEPGGAPQQKFPGTPPGSGDVLSAQV